MEGSPPSLSRSGFLSAVNGDIVIDQNGAVFHTFVPQMVFAAFRLVAYTVPSWFVALLGRRFSITLKFSSLLLAVFALVAIIYGFVRYRYLTKYSRLPPEPERQEPKMDLFIDDNVGETNKSGISSYIDDFLSAIKVFGYLERPVFHELTRKMRTIKLDPGEMIKLKEERGFAVVVDGSVQVFAKSGNEARRGGPPSPSVGYHDINGQQYQLLNEVKRGAPLSSLFSLLSLFTEDVELNENLRTRAQSPDESLPDISLDPGAEAEEREHGSSQPSKEPSPGPSPSATLTEAEMLMDEVVCRASDPSTIAIVPEDAFRKITRKFPKATSHIVQVILTRCQRVTFQTGHYYLGLTPEMFQPEMALNARAKYELPSYLHDSAIRKLNEVVRTADPAEMKASGKVVIKSLASEKKFKSKRTAGSGSHNGSSVNVRTANDPRHPRDLFANSGPTTSSRQVVLEPDASHPGDLLSNVPLSRREQGKVWIGGRLGSISPSDTRSEDDGSRATSPKATSFSTTSFTGDSETEDAILRTALSECIFKFLGLDGSLQSYGRSVTPSVEASPLFSAADSVSARSGISGPRKQSFGYLLNNLTYVSDSDRLSSSQLDDDASLASNQNYENAQREVAENLEIVFYKKGTLLSRQNEKSNGLYYVVEGILEVGYTDKTGAYHELHTVKPGGLGGYIGAILGYRSFADIRAKTDVYLGFLPRTALETIADRYPMMYLNIAKSLTSVLGRLILNLDFALEWVHASAGQVLFREGDESDAIYIVLNGRLRSVVQRDGKMEAAGEYGQGESIGELEVLTVSKRPYTLHAIRDSELARFPRSLFESLALQHPSITFEISRLVAAKVRSRMDKELSGDIRNRSTFGTVAVVPITEGLPVSEFGHRLLTAYNEIGHSTYMLNNATVLSYLGRNAFNKVGRLKLTGYLADLEERYKTVIYVADTSVSSVWTQTCLSQADCILLLADAMAEPSIGEYERLLVRMKVTARTELILIHPDRYVVPGSTAKWLKNRIWVHAHHHFQLQIGSTQTVETPLGSGKLQKLRIKMQTLQSELMTKYRSRRMPVYSSHYAHKNDFCRLARILSGHAVGLVLGGGGARGISHIGVIRALEDNGIPIDFIAGTSIGSFVGGLYARDYDLVSIYGRAKKFASRIASLWRMAFDLTYPATSYTTGHEFNRGIWKAFGDSRIEDFWIRFFTNTTNITHSRMEVHYSGYSWRYIRASMSLAGLLPPLTDKGSMLLDGGYVDNLPVAEMRAQGARVIFAVDVGSIDDTTPMTYGDSLSGLWVLINRWNIFSKHPNVPNLTEIQQRLAYVSSVGALEKAKATPGVLYLRPPIDDYATLDFAKFDEIYRVGTQYAHETLAKWKREGKLPNIPGVEQVRPTRKRVNRRNSI